MIATAFVLGAGLGTRLKSLTARRPKPLIPVCNRPLITYAFDHLLSIGVRRLIVNTHHRAEAYATVFPEPSYRDASLEFRHEPEILETAGGIKNVADLLGDEPFIVYNGDILSDLPLAGAMETHRARGDEVTMVLRSKDGPLEVACDPASGRVTGIGRHFAPEHDQRFLFTGIYIVEPAFLTRIPLATKISVVPIFREMIRTGPRLGGVVVDDGNWGDLGTRENYLAAHRSGRTCSRAFQTSGNTLTAEDGDARERVPPWIHADATIAPGAELSGATAIGAGASVGAGARLVDCVVWEGSEIAPGSDLRECIVTDGQQVSGTHRERDF